MSAYRVPAPPAGRAFPKLRRFRPARTLPPLQGILLAVGAWTFAAMLVAFSFIIMIRTNFQMPSGEVGFTHSAP